MEDAGTLHDNNICDNLFQFLNARVLNHLGGQFKSIGIPNFTSEQTISEPTGNN